MKKLLFRLFHLFFISVFSGCAISSSNKTNIDSYPTGASIYKDSVEICKTPCLIDNKQLSKQNSLIIYKSGFEETELHPKKNIIDSIFPIAITTIAVIPLFNALSISSSLLEIFTITTASYYMTDFSDQNITLSPKMEVN
jgi:hypothetical protein